MRDLRTKLKGALNRRGLRWLRYTLMAVSVFLAPGATPEDDLSRAMDRKGFRTMLAVLWRRSGYLQSLGVTRVLFREGCWIHQNDGQYILADEGGRPVATTEQLIELARENWEFTYAPGPGDVVVDIGAGTGTEVVHWARSVGPTGKVIAVEAHPGTFARLRLLCELNGWSNVQAVNVAVSEVSGRVTIEDPDLDITASIMTGKGSISVPSVTIDQLITQTQLRSVDYLKMNIEGAETLALKGMVESADRIRRICVSCHDFRADWGDGDYYRTKDEVIRLLRQLGFRVEVLRASQSQPWLRDQVSGFRDV
ncbi:MAG: FkbM family methyltransferase [Clostridiales bacterium]|nr:FkbM family methyltransferase [Clostridiales bacterium]